MERKFAALRILSFAGWGGGGGGGGAGRVINYVSDRRTVCVTSACEWLEHPCPHDIMSVLPVRANGQSIHVRTM